MMTTSLVILLLLLPIPVLAADRVQGTLVNLADHYERDGCTGGSFSHPGASSAFVQGGSRGMVRIDADRKVKVLMTKLVGLPPTDQVPDSGDEVICLVHGGETFQQNLSQHGCASFLVRGEITGTTTAGKILIKTTLWNGGPEWVTHVECYEPDPAYDFVAACQAAGSPIAGSPSRCARAQTYVAAPSTPLIAVLGVGRRE
jgi:hypothetical protein